MSFTVERVWMENTTTRQAFYQTLLFVNDRDRHICSAIHYGSLSSCPNKRPVTGGTLKVGPAGGAALRSKRAEKNGRGYAQQGPATKMEFDEERAFRNYLTEQLGAAHRDSVLAFLDLPILAPFDEIPEPKAAIEDITQPAITEYPDTWGTW